MSVSTLNGKALGKHILIEYYGCDVGLLKDSTRLREIILEGVRRSQATIVTDVFHMFSPFGVSGVVVIAESHVAIHTWPEHRCASVDIFSCTDKMIWQEVRDHLQMSLEAESCSFREMARGHVNEAVHKPDFRVDCAFSQLSGSSTVKVVPASAELVT